MRDNLVGSLPAPRAIQTIAFIDGSGFPLDRTGTSPSAPAAPPEGVDPIFPACFRSSSFPKEP